MIVYINDKGVKVFICETLIEKILYLPNVYYLIGE